MKCPIDGTPLVMADRSGVEIDYCPQCRGVWLARRELDKVIERNAAQSAPPPPPRQMQDDRRDYDNRGYDRRPKKKNKLGGFLDDIFDF